MLVIFPSDTLPTRTQGVQLGRTERMNTAQLVLSGGATNDRVKTLTPWIVGGLVVVFALFVIGRIK